MAGEAAITTQQASGVVVLLLEHGCEVADAVEGTLVLDAAGKGTMGKLAKAHGIDQRELDEAMTFGQHSVECCG